MLYLSELRECDCLLNNFLRDGNVLGIQLTTVFQCLSSSIIAIIIAGDTIVCHVRASMGTISIPLSKNA